MSARGRGGCNPAAPLIARLRAVPPVRYMPPVARWLPTRAARILDVGAGVGRDAAWFSARGHRVTAVEPVDALRTEGRQVTGARVHWRGASLPDLGPTGRADLIWIYAVWHHLPPDRHAAALLALRARLARGGRVVIALRDGPMPPARAAHDLDRVRLFHLATSCGFGLLDRKTRASIGVWNRAHRVMWHWTLWGVERRAPRCR
jgi:SAM-dependent methyltransferase